MITVYHNPNCSKSRKALELLWDQGTSFDVVEYLSSPPDRTTLARLIAASGESPCRFVRTDTAEFRDAGLSLTDDAGVAEVVDLLVEHPEVMQRPIVVTADRVIIARPPERVLELLGRGGTE